MTENLRFSIAPSIKYLKIIGIYPINTRYPFLNTLQVCWGYFLYGWYITFNITEFIEMYNLWGDLSDVINNATVSLLYTVGFAKAYILICMKPKFHRMVNIVLDIETKLNLNKEERPDLWDVFVNYSQRAYEVGNFMCFMTTITILGYFIVPHTEAYISGPTYIKFKNGTLSDVVRKPLVFSSWFPWDSNSEKGYLYAFGFQLIAGAIGASFLAFSEIFMIVLMVFIIGQLQLLQFKLRTLGMRTRSKNVVFGVSLQDVHAELSDCILHHHTIIEYMETMRLWLNPVMFLDFMVCSIMLCAIGYDVIQQDMSLRQLFLIEYLVAMLVQLFLFYWHANEVLVESLLVASSIWESNWYTFDLRSRKLLSFILMRSQKALKFTAGPFNVMSLPTYLGVLKASYTYLTLLRQVDNKQK